jgi:hypothetical protein
LENNAMSILATMAGQKTISHDIPKLVKAVEQIAEQLERLNNLNDRALKRLNELVDTIE